MKVKSQAKNISDKSKNPLRKYFLAIFILVFLVYGNSLKNGYALDDNYVTVTTPEIPNNPRVEKGIKGIPEIFTSHYIQTEEQSFDYRPVPLCTFAIEYQFFGSNPFVSHLVNVLFYAFTCVLLFSVLVTLFSGYNIVFPLLITLLFCVHPIHTEVVNNLKSRDELLSFFFGMLALYFFIKKTETKKWMFFLLSAFFLLIALLCKKTAVLFLVLLPLTDYFFRDVKFKHFIGKALLFYLVFVVFTFIQRALLGDVGEKREFAFFENPLFYNDGFFQRVSLACYTVGYYFKLFVFPYPLSSYYGFDTIPEGGMINLFIVVSAVFYISIGVYALIKIPSKSIFSYGICVYLLGIFPFANLVDPMVGILGERFVYFASLGFCIAAVCFIFRIFKMDHKNKEAGIKILPSLVKNGFIGVFIIFSILTFARNNKWKDSLALFSNDVKHFEDSYLLNYFLASTLNTEAARQPLGSKKDFMFKESTKYFARSARLLRAGLGIYNTDYYSFSALGTIYVNYLNNVDAAIPCFKRSLQIKPDYEAAHRNLIFCYDKKKQKDTLYKQKK